MKKILLIYKKTYKKNKKEKRGIITEVVTAFIGLVYEGISSYIHNRRPKHVQKAFNAMERKVTLRKK